MKFELTQEELKLRFDYVDGDLIRKPFGNTPCNFVGTVAGRVHSRGYRMISIDGKEYRAHRLIFLYHHGYLPDMLDHIDRNRLNNRIENLRESNPLDNQRNKNKQKNNTSGINGVHWDKRRRKWIASVSIKQKVIYLGGFDDINDAKHAREMANIKYNFEQSHGI